MIFLYDHQRKAVEKLKPGSILVGGVGSGKSLTSLVYFYEKICGGKVMEGDVSQWKPMQIQKKIYVITRARKKDTRDWEDEAVKIPMEIDIVDSWNNITKYVNAEDAFFIFDEQRVVGSGVWVKSFLKIAKKNQWILLSATPADNWMDLIPVFIANGFYKNRTEFVGRHVIFSSFTKFPKVERYIEIPTLLKHRKEIMVHMYHSKKTFRHDIDIYCKHDETLERTIIKDRWNPYDEEPINDAAQVCYLLRKATNSDKDRLEKVKTIFEKHSKVIIFYNHNYELEALRKFSEENGIEYSEWNGHKHQLIPKTDKWIYLVQYTAGAEGWNCTETNTIIFYSQSYSYKQMTQAAGRIDRLNTNFIDLYYYNLLSKASIDRAIRDALTKKQSFNESSFIFGPRENNRPYNRKE